ncbi:MAG: MFS transporter [Proteobacteria bacterium]|nr:MFS transporter [Pseudomonadota bacterium]
MSRRHAGFVLAEVDKVTLLTILVAALGYFVDIFDLLLFSIVRVQSLKDLGLQGEQLLSSGIMLLNTQMAGLLIGGLLWGMLGDRFGRKSVLFGSILLYSVANLANGFVQDIGAYAVLRFIAGIGLAGELGAGVTLASELLPQKWRGLGTTFISFIGIMGAGLAVAVAEVTDWRTAYIVGGVIGLALLAMRVSVRESDMYRKVRDFSEKIPRGNVLLFFRKPELLRRLFLVILVGGPTWGMVGMFITFTPEFAKDFGMTVLPTAGHAVLFSYIGISIGGAFSGLISQHLQSRRKSVAISFLSLIAFVVLYVSLPYGASTELYYFACFLMGLSCGYWAMFVQMGAEQFGTNIRATAATSIPNFVRAMTIPITMSFHALIPVTGITGAGLTVMGVLMALAFLSLRRLKETFHTDLDYVET